MATQIAIKLYTRALLSERERLEAVLRAFEEAGAPPTELGPEGSPRAFDAGVFLDQVTGSAGPYRFITAFRRKALPRWDGALHTHEAGPNALIINGISGKEGRRRWFDLADALASVAPPVFGFVHVYDPAAEAGDDFERQYRDAHLWTLARADKRGVPVPYARTWLPAEGLGAATGLAHKRDLTAEPWSLGPAALCELARAAADN